MKRDDSRSSGDDSTSTPVESNRKKPLSLPRLQTLDSLGSYPDYRRLWLSNIFSNNAQWLQLLTVGWLVRSLTSGLASSAMLVGAIGGLNTLPGIFVGPIAGALGDRIDRKKMVIRMQIVMAILSMSFALLVRTEFVTVWHAYFYVILTGIGWTSTMPIRTALIANTVPKDSLSNAYATHVLTIPGTRMIGPFIGGILIMQLGFFWIFTLEAFLYIGSIIILSGMNTPYYEPRSESSKESLITDLLYGFRYAIKENKVLLYLIMLAIIPNTLLQPFMFLLPVFTEEVLKRGSDIGGFLMSVNGLGGLIMALFLASFGFIFRKGNIVLVTAIAGSAFILILSHASNLYLGFALILLIGTTLTAFRATSGTLIQLIVPDNVRGRISGIQRLSSALVLLSSVLIGWFADTTSVSIALATIGGAGLFLGVGFYIMSRRIRALE